MDLWLNYQLVGNFGEALGGTCKTCYGCTASKGTFILHSMPL